MEILIVWVGLTIVIGVLANSRGRSGFGWFLLSWIITPLIAGLLALVLPNLRLRQVQETERRQSKTCPYCAELIKAEAVVCKHCGKDVPANKTIGIVAPSLSAKTICSVPPSSRPVTAGFIVIAVALGGGILVSWGLASLKAVTPKKPSEPGRVDPVVADITAREIQQANASVKPSAPNRGDPVVTDITEREMKQPNVAVTSTAPPAPARPAGKSGQPSRVAAATAQPAPQSRSRDPNEANRRLLALNEQDRRDRFYVALNTSGERCPEIIRTFYQGSAKPSWNAIWNVECRGGPSYVIQVMSDEQGSTKVLTCGELRARGGGECFKRYSE